MRSGLLAAALGLAGGLIGVWIGLALGGAERTAPDGMHALIHEELALTSAQETRIDRLEESFAETRAAREAEMATARAAIGEALLNDLALSEDVVAAADRFHQSMGELQLATLDHLLAMRAELTPEQAEEFDAMLMRAFDADED